MGHLISDAMERASSSSPRILFALLLLLLTLGISSIPSTSSSLMAAEGVEKSTGEGESAAAAVHIVYVDRPEGEEPEAFHIRTLASVVGSEEAAKEAVVYHYTHAASGFSARLTQKQVEDLSQQPGVLQVMPDKVLHLHSGQKAARVGTMGLM